MIEIVRCQLVFVRFVAPQRCSIIFSYLFPATVNLLQFFSQNFVAVVFAVGVGKFVIVVARAGGDAVGRTVVGWRVALRLDFSAWLGKRNAGDCKNGG